jgi:hypothetical protein
MNDLVKNDNAIQSALIEIVKRDDVDPGKLEKFLDLQIKMEERQAEKALSAALAGFQKECPIIAKTKKGHNSSYAPYDEIKFVIQPILKKHGLSLSFSTKEVDDQKKEMELTVRHIDGAFFTSKYVFLSLDDGGKMNNSQRIRSANSYAKRTLVENALDIATAGMDDDARRALDTVVTDDQLKKIEELMKVTNTAMPAMLDFLKVVKIEDASKYEADKAIHALKQKRVVSAGKSKL